MPAPRKVARPVNSIALNHRRAIDSAGGGDVCIPGLKTIVHLIPVVGRRVEPAFEFVSRLERARSRAVERDAGNIGWRDIEPTGRIAGECRDHIGRGGVPIESCAVRAVEEAHVRHRPPGREAGYRRLCGPDHRGGERSAPDLLPIAARAHGIDAPLVRQRGKGATDVCGATAGRQCDQCAAIGL